MLLEDDELLLEDDEEDPLDELEWLELDEETLAITPSPPPVVPLGLNMYLGGSCCLEPGSSTTSPSPTLITTRVTVTDMAATRTTPTTTVAVVERPQVDGGVEVYASPSWRWGSSKKLSTLSFAGRWRGTDIWNYRVCVCGGGPLL